VGCPGLGKALFPIDFSEMKIAFRVLVSMNRRVSAFKNIQTIFGGAKELDGLKVTKEFKGHKGPAFQCFTGLSFSN
jgi:hypothetical protein